LQTARPSFPVLGSNRHHKIATPAAVGLLIGRLDVSAKVSAVDFHVRRGISYEMLSERLGAIGMSDTSVNLRNKVSRGKFTTAFFIASLEAMGSEKMRIGE
jgi:hypothetical protein